MIIKSCFFCSFFFFSCAANTCFLEPLSLLAVLVLYLCYVPKNFLLCFRVFLSSVNAVLLSQWCLLEKYSAPSSSWWPLC